MAASSRAALHFYQELRPKERPVDIYTLLRLAEENDPAAIEAVSRQATALGKGLRLIIAALSPELILITGELTSSWERFGPIIQREMESSVLAGPPYDSLESIGHRRRGRHAYLPHPNPAPRLLRPSRSLPGLEYRFE